MRFLHRPVEGHLLGLASGHFSAQIARRDSSTRCRVTPTGNRDAGKFAADATQLPTGCQPESLAKPGTGTQRYYWAAKQ
jgi:hypothetical protein